MVVVVFCFKQKTAYEMRISDGSSDVCSSDLLRRNRPYRREGADPGAARRRLRRWRDHAAGGTLGAGKLTRKERDRLLEKMTGDVAGDRKSVGEGKSVSVRVDLGGRRTMNKEIQRIHI